MARKALSVDAVARLREGFDGPSVPLVLVQPERDPALDVLDEAHAALGAAAERQRVADLVRDRDALRERVADLEWTLETERRQHAAELADAERRGRAIAQANDGRRILPGLLGGVR